MLTAPQMAEARGHDMRPEQAPVRRWRCRRCGQAVSQRGAIVYGAAMDHPCPETPAPRGDSNPIARGGHTP